MRRLAKNPATELMFTQSSGHEAEQTGLTRSDCLRMIAVGRVIRSEMSGPDWRRWVRGTDLDGNTMTLVLTVVPTSENNKRIVILKCERMNEDDHNENRRDRRGTDGR